MNTYLFAAAILVVENVTFDVSTPSEKGSGVVGELRIPASGSKPLPAVLIVNSSPGFDGRGAFYAKALNAAGFATFEIDVTLGRGMAASPRHHLPHVFASLERLAADARIDPEGIGVMGFSYGATLALLASSEALARETKSSRRFAAHLPLYPVCWRQVEIVQGRSAWKDLGPRVYREVTGRPVHVLVGNRDGYDHPGDCAAFRDALDARVRPHYAVTTYPEATFAWDSPFGSATWAAGGNRGKGSNVEIRADPQIAKQSSDFAVEFFGRHLRR